MKPWLAALALLVAAGCATRAPAPVVERAPPPVVAPPAAEPPPLAEAPKPPEKPVPTHVVKRGETLVSIALQYGLDYRELAAWNSIANLNALGVGQVLVLAAPSGMAVATPVGPVATPLVAAGPPIEARPLANSPNAKVEPRGQKVPFSERALAALGAADPGGPVVAIAPPVAPPTAPQPPPEK